MPDKDVPRSIRFSSRLWDAIDQDARRCKRSSQKHLEAILELFYDIQDVEIDESRLEEVKRHIAPVVATISPAIDREPTKAEVRRMIGAAATAEFQVGRFEGKWDPKTIAKFRTLLDLGTVQK